MLENEKNEMVTLLKQPLESCPTSIGILKAASFLDLKLSE